MTDFERSLLDIENELMTGKCAWIADFNESFRNLKIGDISFDMVVRGNTRGKSMGLFLAKIYSYFTLPSYDVACLVLCVDSFGERALKATLRAVTDYLKNNDLKWAWLVFLRQGPFSDEIRKAVEKMKFQELGVALIDIGSNIVIPSNSYLGRSIPKYLKLKRRL
jgi:hypothetical protein